MNSVNEIYRDIEKYKNDVIHFRRTIHKNPELGLEENETADFICYQLEKLGIKYTRNETAICGIIPGSSDTHCVALRAGHPGLRVSHRRRCKRRRHCAPDPLCR